MAQPQAQRSTVGEIRQLLTTATEAARRLGRTDLARRLTTADGRLERPSAVLCVVGEFKQGKSALINGMVGRPVCPVDDHLATTAVTWLFAADQPVARIRGVDGSSTEVGVDEIGQFVSEAGDPEQRASVNMAEIGLPNSVLGKGLSLVDTPGVGGIRPGAATAVQGFLPWADAVLFVSDASAELTLPEISFLSDVRELCPSVLVAVSKIDLYPQWQRIAELNEGHLRRAGLEAAPIPVSARLHAVAAEADDDELDSESGFPQLLDLLDSELLASYSRHAEERAVAEVESSLRLLADGVGATQGALADPQAAQDLMSQVEETQERLTQLQKAGSRWSTQLGDAITDLAQGAEQVLRSGMRELLESTDERWKESDPAGEWELFVEELQAKVVALAQSISDSIEEGVAAAAEQIAATISEDAPGLPQAADLAPVDPEGIWGATERELGEGAGLGSSVLTALRGTSSGVMMLGMLGRVAGLAVATPLAVGAGLLLGVKTVRDARQQQVERRRREARSIVQQYLGQAQSELSPWNKRLIQESQRAMRDHFSEVIAERKVAYSEALASLQQTLNRTAKERKARLAELAEWQEALDKMQRRANALAAEVAG